MNKSIPLRLTVATLVALAVLGSTAYIHGRLTDRWGLPVDVQERVDRLSGIPLRFGDWEGEELMISPRELEAAEIVGYISRRYRSDRGVVNVMIVGGRFGPIAVHPPTTCLPGSGFTVASKPMKVNLPASSGSSRDQLWQADFRKQVSGVPMTLRVCWGWSSDGAWSASDSPRSEFAGSPVLYKMYVYHEVRSDEDDPDGPREEFLKEFLSAVDAALSTPSYPPELSQAELRDDGH